MKSKSSSINSKQTGTIKASVLNSLGIQNNNPNAVVISTNE